MTADLRARTQLAQPEGEGSHHITPDDFRRWWRETGSASPAPSPEMLLTANAWAQYCLDRWGRPTPPPPADGEVEELVSWLGEEAADYEMIGEGDQPAHRCRRAAELLQRQRPQPPADEEVVELVEWLLREADYQEITCKRAPCADRIRRAAELLQRQHPQSPADGEVEEFSAWELQRINDAYWDTETCTIDWVGFANEVLARWGSFAQPAAKGEAAELSRWLLGDRWLFGYANRSARAKFTRIAYFLQQFQPVPAPLSQRPWEREGWCDGEGWCWAWSAGNCGWWEWVDSKMILYSHDEYTHCLPFHALPLPTTEETSR